LALKPTQEIDAMNHLNTRTSLSHQAFRKSSAGNAGTRFFRTPLAAAVALTLSTGALAAPGKPSIEMGKTEFRMAADRSGVDVPVRWQQFSGDPATSVQYLVDDLQTRVRRVDADDATEGEITLSFNVGGDYTLSVALCNADGCSESDPATISVIDPAGTYLLDADAAVNMELAAISTALEESLTYYESIYGPRETWAPEVQVKSARFAWSVIAKTVGKGVFNGMLGKVGGEGMGRVMALMGYDPQAAMEQRLEDMQSALGDLSQSMDALHDKIDGIASQLDDIVDQIDDATGQAMWDTFRSNDSTLRLTVLPQIEDLFSLINFWSEDNPPTPSLLERYVTDVAQAIRGIRTAVVGNQGTLTMLLEAHGYTGKVSDLEDYWAFVEAYREEWRAVLAQALVALEYMRAFDDSGYTAYQLQSSRQVADAAVEAMWATGLAIPQDPKFGYVHVRGQDWIVTREATAMVRRPELSTEAWAIVDTRLELEPRVQALVNNYRPDLNSGRSLESWLYDRWMSPQFPFLDSASHERAFINGNSYYVGKGGAPSSPQAKFLTVQTNVGGRAASFEPDAIQGMAFGFELDLDATESGKTLVASAENAFDAPDVRLLDAETGETLDYQVAGSTRTYTLDPGSAVTIQLGERAVAESSDELFGPVAEMTVILPGDRDRLQLSVD
jgi:hypothetical protein